MNGILSPLLRAWRFSVVKKHVSGHILDYGCGVGHLPSYIKEISSYVGVDVNNADLTIAKLNNCNSMFCRPEQLIASVKFDTIVSLAVIEYIEDLNIFLKKLKPYLRKDGVIVITSPHPISRVARSILIKVNLLGSVDNEKRLWLPRKNDLVDIAEKSGLELTCFKRFMFGLNQIWIFK